MFYSQQQLAGLQVDWSNPITRGLIAFVDAQGRYNLVNGGPLTVTGMTGEGSGGLYGLRSTYTSGQWASVPYKRPSTMGAMSAFMLADYLGTIGPNNFLFGDTQASGTDYNWGLYSNGANFLAYVKNAGGSGVNAQGTAVPGTAVWRRNHRLGMTYDGATIRIYQDGAQTGSNSQTGNVQGNSLGLNVNRWNSGTNDHNQIFYLGGVWNRVLTAAEMASLAANPWQLIADPADQFNVFTAAAGSDVTVSITGQGATAYAGSLAPGNTVALSGGVVTSAIGTLIASLAAAITGNTSTSTAGNVAAALSSALSGASFSASPGTVTASQSGNVTVSISGVAVSVLQGLVVPGLQISVTGSGGALSAGSVTSGRSVGLVGSSTTATPGTVSTTGGAVSSRSKGLRKTRYTPNRVPAEQAGLGKFLQTEIERITDGFESPFTVELLEKLYEEPSRKLSNTAVIAYADGTLWNPGSGEGIYAYYNGTWKKVA